MLAYDGWQGRLLCALGLHKVQRYNRADRAERRNWAFCRRGCGFMRHQRRRPTR